MGELRDLIGIFGAVDLAAAADRDSRAALAKLVPLYAGHEEGVHWYDDFRQWEEDLRTDEAVKALPSNLEEALVGLGPIEADRRPRPRMLARRLFALALAARVEPGLTDPEHRLFPGARDALQAQGLADSDEAAEELLRLLGDDELLGDVEVAAPDEWWDKLLRTASARGLINIDPALLGPRPCTGELVEVDLPGGARTVATLRTYFETDKVEFARATSFLEPANWPACNDFWCEMNKVGELPSGVHRYDEVVSLDCQNKPTTLTIRAQLDFKYWEKAGVVSVAEYQMSPQQQPGNVLVDEGSLVVHKLGAAANSPIAVTTTKRVLFDREFDGSALALIMCWVGYAEVAHDFVFNCAALPEEEAPGTEFPGQQPAVPEKGEDEDCPEFAPAIKAMADEAAASLKACIDEYAEAAQASSEKIEKGEYKADDAVSDMAKMSVRMLRESAAAVDAGLRGARTIPRPRARERPENER